MHYHAYATLNDDAPVWRVESLATNDEVAAATWLDDKLGKLWQKDPNYLDHTLANHELRRILQRADFPSEWEGKCGAVTLRLTSWSADWCEYHNGLKCDGSPIEE